MKDRKNLAISILCGILAAGMIAVSIWAIVAYLTSRPIGDDALTIYIYVIMATVYLAFAVVILVVSGIIGLIRGKGLKKTMICMLILLVVCWAAMPLSYIATEEIYYSGIDYDRIDRQRAELNFDYCCDRLETMSSDNGDELKYRGFYKEIPRPTEFGSYSYIVITGDGRHEVSVAFSYLEKRGIMKVEVSYLLIENQASQLDWNELGTMTEYYNAVAASPVTAEDCKGAATDDSYVQKVHEGYTENVRMIDDYAYIRCQIFTDGDCRVTLTSMVAAV